MIIQKNCEFETFLMFNHIERRCYQSTVIVTVRETLWRWFEWFLFIESRDLLARRWCMWQRALYNALDSNRSIMQAIIPLRIVSFMLVHSALNCWCHHWGIAVVRSISRTWSMGKSAGRKGILRRSERKLKSWRRALRAMGTWVADYF